ncbi:hypothetical protein [Spiroplasma alleghenense]|uniref:Transmembrane protein n=1 Tax=Spiroplasma alleghenense TaxID=216931 RepID=A0A345Z4N7_9MOLU|nr:hypothetical protein [Spiroplasma alleghenense]AXK51566.1 hypothetical protein SALLE_v1c08960 [Spiroplasma alleghenense]
MKKIDIRMEEGKEIYFKNVFAGSKKLEFHYYFVTGFILPWIFINLYWLIWLRGEEIFFKDLPGMEESFLNSFLSRDININFGPKFKPSMMIFGFGTGITNWAVLIPTSVLFLFSILWPAIFIFHLVNSVTKIKNSIFLKFRKFLILLNLVLPAFIIVIVQNFYMIDPDTFSNSFKTQFFNQFLDLGENNWSLEIQNQFEIAKEGAKRIFNSGTNEIFSTFSTIFSIVLLSGFAFFGNFAAFSKFDKNRAKEIDYKEGK